MDQKEKRIEDIYCPYENCRKSLIVPANFLKINGKLAESVLSFKIENQAGDEGLLELSLEPGDYKNKHVSIPMKEKEFTKMYHHGCGQILNAGNSSAKFLVKYEHDPLLYVCHISARYNECITIIDYSGRFICYGERYKDYEAYRLALEEAKNPKKFSHKSFYA